MASSSSSSDSIFIPGESSELLPSGSTLETLLALYDVIDDTADSDETREYVTRFREEALQTHMNDYFVERPKFNDERFRERLYEFHEDQHHIPGMLGSIDCTHFVCRNCPRHLRGQYKRGDHQYPTIMLEATASYDLWIWHSFFGPLVSNNDINVLNQSPLYVTERNGTAPNRIPLTRRKRSSRSYKSLQERMSNELLIV